MSKADRSTVFNQPELYGTPIVNRETEYRNEAPVYNREQAEVYESKIVTERPIVRQKDIYHIEKPIYIEKPEFVEKQIYQTGETITETFNPVFSSEETREAVEIRGQPRVHSDTRVMKQAPIIEFERPEVYEKEIIHEQAIIHDQPIINLEKQIIQERPEVHERRIFHQEPVKVVQEQTIIREEQGKP